MLSFNGFTVAARQGNVEIVMLLSEYGADLNAAEVFFSICLSFSWADSLTLSRAKSSTTIPSCTRPFTASLPLLSSAPPFALTHFAFSLTFNIIDC